MLALAIKRQRPDVSLSVNAGLIRTQLLTSIRSCVFLVVRWYDTNSDILRAAYGAAAIALAAAALVILFSSRSVILTLFAVFTIAFILTSVTSMLVAAGWTLGL